MIMGLDCLTCRERLRDGIVQPVQEAADFSSCGSVPGGEVKKMESDSFCNAE